MGFEGGGRRRRAIPVEVERGGLRFQLDAAAGTVTCPICRAFGSAAGPDMPVFMAKHVAEHVGTAATPAPTVDRGAVIAALAEQLAQLRGGGRKPGKRHEGDRKPGPAHAVSP